MPPAQLNPPFPAGLFGVNLGTQNPGAQSPAGFGGIGSLVGNVIGQRPAQTVPAPAPPVTHTLAGGALYVVYPPCCGGGHSDPVVVSAPPATGSVTVAPPPPAVRPGNSAGGSRQTAGLPNPLANVHSVLDSIADALHLPRIP